MYRQLPTHSPLTVRALAAGAAGAFGTASAGRITTRIRFHWWAREVMLTGSGTQALTLALLAALERRPGLVALPAYGCYDLATAALGAGATVVLYDLDPDSLQPDPASLEAALAHRPSALVLVHLYGIPVDVACIVQAARAGGTLVIEDAAQAFGATIDRRPAGSLGSLAVLSFGRGKGLTGGSGGALLANDDSGVEAIASARARLNGSDRPRGGWAELAKTSAQWLLARPAVYAIPAALPFLRLGETVFHAPSPVRPMARASMRILDSVWTRSLRATKVRYDNALRLLATARADAGWRALRILPHACPGYLRLPLRPPGDDRPRVLTPAAIRLGIIQGYPLPLSALDGFRDRCVNSDASLPGARLLAESLITLPTHERLSASDLRAIPAWLREMAAARASDVGVGTLA
jgi:perosamine synthetase